MRKLLLSFFALVAAMAVNAQGNEITKRLALTGGSGAGSEMAIEVLEANENGEPLSAKYTITNATWGNNASHLSLFKYAPLSAEVIGGYDKAVIEFAETVPASVGEVTYGFIPVGFVCPAGWTSIANVDKFEYVFTDENKASGVEDFSIFFNANGDLKSTTVTINGVWLVKELPELTINGIYSEDFSSWTATVEPLTDGNSLYYTIEGGEAEPEYQLVEGPITLGWLESQVEAGACKYVVVVQEKDAEGNVVAQGVVEVSLAKPTAMDVTVNYSEDYSSCKLFAYPSEEGNKIYYAFDENPETYEGEVPAEGLLLAYTPGLEEVGTSKLVVYLFEVDADKNVVKTAVEEVTFGPVREDMAGDNAENPIILADSWSDFVAADKIGADEAGYAHFQYTATATGMFVFSCNYEIKAFGAGSGMLPVGSAAGVRFAYGKAVQEGEVVKFSAYLPQSYEGVAFDENGNEIEGETELYEVKEYSFYAGVEEMGILTINGIYSEDYSTWTATVEPLVEGNSLYYTIEGGEADPEYQLVEGPITLAWLESLEEVGACKYVVIVKEVDADGKIVAQGVVEVSLVKASAMDVTVNYSEDYSSCKLFAYPSEEGNKIYYAFEENPETYEGEVPAEGLLLAYTPGLEEVGTSKLVVYLFEVDADKNVVKTAVEEVTFGPVREDMAGDNAENPVVLADGWSENIAADKIGADEAGYAHFKYTAAKDGLFVFSCGYEIKAFDAECGMKAVESTAGVRFAYGKEVKAGDVVTFSAYLPQTREGVAFDENGDEIEGKTEQYDIDSYMFYAAVEEKEGENGEGVAEIKAAIAEGAVFDLAGRRVNSVKNGGLYIIGGKKVRF